MVGSPEPRRDVAGAAHTAAAVELRPATFADAAAVADVYLRSRKELVAFAPLVHSDDDVREWIRARLIPMNRTTVAVVEGEVVGFLSLSTGDEASWIDHLYARPDWTGRGVGPRLLDHALRELPPPVRLYTFQQNLRACRFYEARGFTALALGDGSENEERCPDVLYEWRPRG
jgi:ribosomal protein S18 acetylase RimI-like enzyme